MATPADEGTLAAQRDDRLYRAHERIARALKQIERWGTEQCAGRVETTGRMVQDAESLAADLERIAATVATAGGVQ